MPNEAKFNERLAKMMPSYQRRYESAGTAFRTKYDLASGYVALTGAGAYKVTGDI